MCWSGETEVYQKAKSQMLDDVTELEVIRKDAIRLATVVVNLSKKYKSFHARARGLGYRAHSAPANHGNWSTSAKSYEQFIKNFWNWNTITSHHGVRGQSAFDVAEQIAEGTWMIPTSTSQSHDLRRQPPADPPPSGRDRAQVRRHGRATDHQGHPPPMAARNKCLAQNSRSQGRRAMGGN